MTKVQARAAGGAAGNPRPVPSIQVVLPVLDEVEALGWVLDRFPCGYEPLVVDNGSTDGSGALARKLGAEVVEEAQPGFGAACFAGLAAATSPLVCFMDADGSLDPAELPKVVAPLEGGRADLVLGTRVCLRGAQAFRNRAANRALVWQLHRVTGVHLHDLGPMRAARRDSLMDLGIRDRRCGWPLEMVLRALNDRWRVEEVPVSYAPRRGGRSKVTGTLRGTLRTVRDMGAVLGDVAVAQH